MSTLTAGTYTVVVSDANGNSGGCSATAAFVITEPTVLTTNLIPSIYAGGFNVSGCVADGTIDLTPGGGNPGYTYLWNTGAVTQDLNGLVAGLFTVTVTDLNGCSTTTSIALTQPSTLSQAIAATVFPSGTNISCFGLSNGNINLTIGGGVPGYTYLWNNGAVTEDLNNIPAGAYSVIVTDLAGCQITSSIILTQPAVIMQTISSFTYPSGTNISCFGLNDGSIDLNIIGGNPGYTYGWSNGGITQDLAGLPAGTYNVIVTDVNGCSIPSSITLTQPTILTQGFTAFTYPSGTNISCFGLSNGSVDLTIGGGNPGYSYTWSNGSVTQDLTGVPAGTYNVTVTDINGCTIPSSISLTQPTILTQGITAFTYPSGTNISCFGFSDGSIDLTINGGNPSYSYVWNNGAITQDIAGLSAGTYNVIVTDINGCSVPSTITLTQPTALTQGISATVYPSGTNISCFGLSDGNIDLTIGGGNPGYLYSWSNGASTQDISGIPAGTYNVTITDINGCTIPSAITLMQPTLLTTNLVPSLFASGFNLSGCLPDGTITQTVGGGNPGYTYVWSNGSTNEDLTALSAGLYSVTATDINGCQVSSSITLTQPAPLTQGITAFTYPSGTNISCNGLSNGSIDLTINGGVPGYTYLWNNGAVTQDLVGIAAGTYSVIVTDQNNCQITSTITLTQPSALTQGITAFTYPSGTNISCYGLSNGSIDLTIGGGNPGYAYVWNTGAVTQDLAGMPSGSYNVTVTDINGCTIPSTITLTQPSALTQSVTAFTYPSGTNISCFGLSNGSIDLTIGGGNPGYTYNWSNGSISEDLIGLPFGTYNVTVTDINGCSIPTSITLTQPAVLTQSVTAFTYPSGTNISCFGLNNGSVDLNILGGNPGYSYVWNTGAVTQDLTSLTAGTYNVVVTDINGCTIPATISLTQPTVLTQNVTAFTYPSGTNISCFGLSDGSVNLTPGGGNPGYSYLWSNGAITQDLAGISSGTYNVTVTDINGCTIPSSITLIQPTALTQNVTAFTYPSGTNISCFGLSDGSIDLTIGGGNPGYTYSWSNGVNTEDLIGLPFGTYNVTVTDINGCTILSSITLTQPTALTQAITSATYPSGTNISCFGLSDGSVDLTIGGGSPGYSYVWSNGAVTQDLVGLPIGTYNVNITDMNGCSIPSTISLFGPSALTQGISATTYPSGTNISCFGLSDGSIDLTIGGGNPGYSYLWNNGALTQDVTGLSVGTYNVIVTDINGCSIPSTISLTQPTVLTQGITAFAYPSGTNISCFGLNDGSINLTIGGGNPNYTYVWSNGALTEDISTLTLGTYTVTVTDINGCQITSAITLIEPTVLATSNTVSVYAGGFNVSGCVFDGWIDLTPIGGNPNYTYAWSNGAITEDISALTAGNFSVTVTDINGCQSTLNQVLTQPQQMTSTTSVVSNYNGQDISCTGASDGAVDVLATGGVAPYTFSWTDAAGTVISNIQNPSGLPSGLYTVTIVDQNGCTVFNNIVLTDPPAFVFNAVVSTNYNGQNISCFGGSDGAIDLSVSGGIPAYSYAWTNSVGGVISVIQDPFNLSADVYSVLVTDANGCVFNTSIQLTEPTELGGTAAVTSDYNGADISCFSLSDGAVIVNPVDGTPGYTFQWTDAGGAVLGTNQNQSGLPVGTYDVEITDLNGCTFITNVILTQPIVVTIGTTFLTNYFGQPVSCVGATDGIVQANTAGGTPGYTYSWNGSPFSATNPLTNQGVETLNVIVMDANGCTAATSTILAANPLPPFNLPPVIYSCAGYQVSINSMADPGSSCTWVFSDGQVINDCGPIYVDFPNSEECYDMTLTVLTPQGCISSTSMTNFICIVPNPIASFSADTYEISTTNPDVFFNNTSIGADEYFWNFGDGSEWSQDVNPYHIFPVVDDTSSYNIWLYAISPYGCLDSTVRVIEIKEDVILYVPNTFTPDGDEYNNNFIPIFSGGFSEEGYSLLIFNRWGELLFESHDTSVGWDGNYKGNLCQDGTYTWKISVKNKETNEVKDYVGHVNLLR